MEDSPLQSKLELKSYPENLERIKILEKNFSSVRQNLKSHSSKLSVPLPKLVAVSKKKPASDIYFAKKHCNQSVFGENYVQELEEKVNELNDPLIEWHYIGGLQSNKTNKLVKIAKKHNLIIQTVQRLKIAKVLEKACVSNNLDKLKIYIQVNTSQESSKSGTNLKEWKELVEYVLTSCPHLDFKGFMTIGESGSLEDFKLLSAIRNECISQVKNCPKSLELSMGMSGDYIEAMNHGSTVVRIGSSLFGARQY